MGIGLFHFPLVTYLNTLAAMGLLSRVISLLCGIADLQLTAHTLCKHLKTVTYVCTQDALGFSSPFGAAVSLGRWIPHCRYSSTARSQCPSFLGLGLTRDGGFHLLDFLIFFFLEIFVMRRQSRTGLAKEER